MFSGRPLSVRLLRKQGWGGEGSGFQYGLKQVPEVEMQHGSRMFLVPWDPCRVMGLPCMSQMLVAGWQGSEQEQLHSFQERVGLGLAGI